MQIRITMAGLAVMALALPATADTLDLNLSSDAFGVKYTRELPPEGLEAGAGLLYHDDDGQLLEAEMHLVDQPEPGRDALLLGLGGKLVYADDDVRDATGFSLAIGGKLNWTLPRYNRAAVGASLYFAPSVTSTSDIDGYQSYAVQGEFKVLEDARIYLGYRHVELSFDGASDRTFEDGVYGGIRLDF